LIIGFVEPHLKVFGGIRRIVELSNRLTARGHEVTIYHPDGGTCEWMPLQAATRPSTDLLGRRHDVVIYNDPNPYDVRLVGRSDSRLKVFYVLELYELSLLTGFHPALWLPRNERTRYMKKSLLSEHAKLVNATWLGDWLRAKMGIDTELLIGGVNREMFHPVDVPRPDGVFRVLCSGDPRPRKGTATIREAIGRVREKHPRVELQQYHGRGIPQERMAETYAAADLFVEASWQAGWNNPVVEAMACGTPVVCTDIGGVRDFAFQDRTAMLVPPRDPDALARAVARMVEDDDLRRELRAAALDHVRSFDWDASAERLERWIEERLGGGDA